MEKPIATAYIGIAILAILGGTVWGGGRLIDYLRQKTALSPGSAQQVDAGDTNATFQRPKPPPKEPEVARVVLNPEIPKSKNFEVARLYVQRLNKAIRANSRKGTEEEDRLRAEENAKLRPELERVLKEADELLPVRESDELKTVAEGGKKKK